MKFVYFYLTIWFGMMLITDSIGQMVRTDYKALRQIIPSYYRNWPRVKASHQYENWNVSSLPEDKKSFQKLVRNVGKVHTLFSDPERIRFFESMLNMQNTSKALLSQCNKDVIQVLEDVETQPYAWTMLDSIGKQGSGVLEGNLYWMGQYFECMESKTDDFKGQWCEAYFGSQYVPEKAGLPLGLYVGVCAPSTCNEEEVQKLYLFFSNGTANPNEVHCPQKPTVLYTRDIIAIVITSVLVLSVIIATVFDLAYIENKRERQCLFAEHSQISLGVGSRLLLSFSAYTNTKKLLDMKKRKDNMSVLDGMRFITMTWVILGHSLYFPSFFVGNFQDIPQYTFNHPMFQVIVNATYSVDTFFCLGGFLVCLLAMKELKKNKGYMNVPLAYLHRYIRLTPAYAFSLLFLISLFRWMGEGPNYSKIAEAEYNNCKDIWWSNLLYINNLYPSANYCFGWAWYLANDMQFFILSPIFLLILYRWRKTGITLLLFCLASSIAVTATFTAVKEIQPPMLSSVYYMGIISWFFNYTGPPPSYEDAYTYDVYSKPWCRLGAYLIGMLAGYLIYTTKGKLRMPWWVVTIGWITAIGTSFSILFGLIPALNEERLLSTVAASFYEGLSRPAWSLCMAWVIVACLTGYGGPVTTLLSWKVFIPLSRLTFCAYMLHPMVLFWYNGTQERAFNFLVGNLVFYHLGVVTVSYAAAYLLSVTVEGPMIGVEKILMGMCRPNSAKVETKNLQNEDVKTNADNTYEVIKLPSIANGNVTVANEYVMEAYEKL